MRYQYVLMLSIITGLLASATAHADAMQGRSIALQGDTVTQAWGNAPRNPCSTMRIEVGRNGDAVTVDADFVVPATPAETWEVLTDFNNMAQFLPNIRSSRIIGEHGNVLQVEQYGKASYGPFSFAFHFVREIALIPQREIRSHVISGNFHRLDSLLTLMPEGNDTRILYRSESVPGFFLPNGIAASVTENTTRGQLEAMQAEIQRRKALQKK